MLPRPAFLLCLTALIALAAAVDYHGKAWQAQSAAAKFSALGKGVAENPHTAGYPSSIESAALFIEGMTQSFQTVADDMPKEVLGLLTRRKLVHSVGLMGVAAWTPVPNRLNYTGIFASGCQQVLVRLSSGSHPSDTGNNSGMVQGVALKFLRDGIPSANIHTLGTPTPQASFNFFAHDFSNHMPDAPYSAPAPALLIRNLFAQASAYPTWVGLSGAARADVSGRVVPRPWFPWRIILHPTPAVHGAMPDTNPGAPWHKLLPQRIRPGPLFSVWAIDRPQDDANPAAAVLIAQITLQTTFTESFFGDRTLFYQHVSHEDDLSVIPAWKGASEAIQQAQRQSPTQIYYPDLPWN